ncbi:MAG TPA: hypothetical protein VIG48_12250 [Jatrophihabitans sp.]|jgi:hypothetical protein
MISLDLARKLRDAGLRWDPAPGDRFVVADRGMDEEIFTLSDMTVEMHEFPDGQVIGFNGTVEWALDSVEARNSVWLPSEAQLRERLGGAFRRLCRTDGGFLVEIEVAGRSSVFESGDVAEAYGLALLYLAAGASEVSGESSGT